jgi:hypothetical protein
MSWDILWEKPREDVADIHEHHDLDVALGRFGFVHSAKRQCGLTRSLRPISASNFGDRKQRVPRIGLTIIERIRGSRLDILQGVLVVIDEARSCALILQAPAVPAA